MVDIIILLGIFVIISSILVILFFLVRFVDSRTRNLNTLISHNELYDYMSKLDKLIESSVVSTNQTFVSTLKEQNLFSQLDKEEAFEMCKDKIFKSLKENNPNFISPYVGNLSEWINSRIEYYVHQSKNAKS